MTSLVTSKNDRYSGYCNNAAKSVLHNINVLENRCQKNAQALKALAPKLDFLTKKFTKEDFDSDVEKSSSQIREIARVENNLCKDKTAFINATQKIISSLGSAIGKSFEAKISSPKSIHKIAKKCRLYKKQCDLYTKAKESLYRIQTVEAQIQDNEIKLQELLKLKPKENDAAGHVRNAKKVIEESQKIMRAAFAFYEGFLKSVNPCWKLKSDIVAKLDSLHSKCKVYLEEQK